MVSDQNSVWVQSGVFSSGTGCALRPDDVPAVYTRVSRYQNWISSQVGGGGDDVPGFVRFSSGGGVDDTDGNVTCPGSAQPTTAATTTPPMVAVTTTALPGELHQSVPSSSSA